jgi:hypothetical protein
MAEFELALAIASDFKIEDLNLKCCVFGGDSKNKISERKIRDAPWLGPLGGQAGRVFEEGITFLRDLRVRPRLLIFASK